MKSHDSQRHVTSGLDQPHPGHHIRGTTSGAPPGGTTRGALAAPGLGVGVVGQLAALPTATHRPVPELDPAEGGACAGTAGAMGMP